MTPEELDRLEELLAGEAFAEEAMTLDILQGFLCAIISGPELLPPSAWLPLALGEQPKYASLAHARETLDLIMQFYNDVAIPLAQDEEFDLFLYGTEEDPDAVDYAPWCEGYLFGSQSGQLNWFDAAGEFAPDLSEKMEIFMLLSGMLKEDALQHKEPWLSPAEEARAIAQAERDLPGAVHDIYRFWRTHPQVTRSTRQTAREPGRNAPCPCGSGKKYKQCCGKPTLH